MQAPADVLTPTALAHHLACRHLTQIERARRESGLTFDQRQDPRAEAMRQRGEAHERAFVERLRAAGRSVHDLRHAPASATLVAMSQGWDVLVQAPLAAAAKHGVADVLARVATPSLLGSWSYEPYDTKLARATKASTLLQLAAYADLLAAMQGVAPARVHVVTPIAEESYRTSEFVAYARLVQRDLAAALAGPAGHASVPEPVAHCDACSYFVHCDAARRRADHLSYVAGLTTRHRRELQRQGIETLTAFAATAGRLPAPPRRGRAETYARLAAQAELQVQARGAPRPPVVVLAVEPQRGLCRLPEPSPGDVFLDLEGDPFVGDGGREYLTGYMLADGAYTAHWATDPVAERRALEAFLDFVAARLRQYPDLHVYHFGHYEPAAIKRLVQRYGARADLLDVLLRGERFVDLHAVVREGLRIGIERYGLKELEAVFEFRRALDLATAGRARQHVELALELDDHAAIDGDTRAQLTAYNRDDCAATRALRAWLEDQRAALCARGDTIARPAAKDGAAPPEIAVREGEIEAIASALRAGLPEDPALRTPEQAARALLADQLGYFRREAKSAWWEYFRLRELEHDALLDEREAIAGLRWVQQLPRQPGERQVRHLYTFPPQDVTIDAGDELFTCKGEDSAADGLGTRVGTVQECDPEAGTLVIRRPAHAAALGHPSAVIRRKIIRADDLERALLALAVHVQQRGTQRAAPFGAALDLLLRRAPRVRSEDGALPQRPAESAIAAAVRVGSALDDSVLAIQGPPGSGKTYSGAHAILALMCQGRRVGVTAVAHKVIDNLLDEVGRAAAAAGQRVRLVHKHTEAASPAIDYVKTDGEALAALAPGAVVGGTAWLWADAAAEGQLDYLFVDEAGQMALAQALAAARATRNLVLLGDPQQLEQPRKGAHPEGSDVAALVHVLGREQHTLPPDRGLFLARTFRLHPVLCAFTSEVWYDGKLAPAPDLERQALGGDSAFAGAGLFLVEVAHDGNQAQADEEVSAVVAIARTLLRGDGTWTNHEAHTRALAPGDILVVAPYNAQVAALRRALSELGVVRVGTVDRFQGQEAPVVIYSCTSSSAQDAPRGMAFLYDPHRFNVATSRARSTVIVVGSPALFAPECRTPAQVQMANGLCRFRELAHAVHL